MAILFRPAAKDFEDFMNLAKQARTFVNEGLFAYAASVAILHRDDCKGVTVPPIQEVFPDRFVPSETISLALKEVTNHPDKVRHPHLFSTNISRKRNSRYFNSNRQRSRQFQQIISSLSNFMSLCKTGKSQLLAQTEILFQPT